MEDSELEKLQSIIDKIEWEGWPEAITWFSSEDFEDEEVANLIDDAWAAYDNLDRVKQRLFDRLKELGVDVYI